MISEILKEISVENEWCGAVSNKEIVTCPYCEH
jgi:hypothetical protein